MHARQLGLFVAGEVRATSTQIHTNDSDGSSGEECEASLERGKDDCEGDAKSRKENVGVVDKSLSGKCLLTLRGVQPTRTTKVFAECVLVPPSPLVFPP